MFTVQEYTEDAHAEALQKLLIYFSGEIGKTCPMTLAKPNILYYNTCCTCLHFIGLKSPSLCPCNQLGVEEAVKRTYIALEEKGYI